jgi:hypothetical protein
MSHNGNFEGRRWEDNAKVNLRMVGYEGRGINGNGSESYVVVHRLYYLHFRFTYQGVSNSEV